MVYFDKGKKTFNSLDIGGDQFVCRKNGYSDYQTAKPVCGVVQKERSSVNELLPKKAFQAIS